ncbi:glycoside hydrolase family protein [Paracoccus sp. MBLB3053]|uniref:Lysozyme n=1 Tax=Paracoccus aurantius TaxID=3073814 RepID=A0ABU2HT77_9RHOB|nr:glycoside hydrolase family protein [Paracoccus sp. MBLB3053]MDS9468223.1 glycoside hydrolase family protein [Paracoccus sp. MBLB3053]
MKTNDAGLQVIKDSEGLRLTAYYDSGRVLTIGYGHTSAAGSPRVAVGMTITAAEADEILRRDVAGAEAGVAELVTIDLTENQFSALVSFVFNIGRGQFAASTLLRKLNAGADPASEFDRWIYDDGVRLNGLVTRRAKERALFEKPIAGTPAESRQKQLQRQLAALGLYTAKIDGIWGPLSRSALEKFELAAERILALA